MSFKLGSDPKSIWSVIHIQYLHRVYCSRHFFLRGISPHHTEQCENVFPFLNLAMSLLFAVFGPISLPLLFLHAHATWTFFPQLLQSISLHQHPLARCPSLPQRKHGPCAVGWPLSNLFTLPVACRACASLSHWYLWPYQESSHFLWVMSFVELHFLNLICLLRCHLKRL